MDERVKHRLIGLAVILSIAAIFAPAVIKKSNQRPDGNVSFSVKLPPKPVPPKVVVPEKNKLFETVRVAHVEMPEPTMVTGSTIPALTKAQPLSGLSEIKQIAEPMALKAKLESEKIVSPKPALVVAAKKTVINKSVALPHPDPKINAKSTSTVAKKPLPSKPAEGRYAVQLATFANKQNADSLLAKLHAKGYKATYNKVATKEGVVYKVIVGQATQREQAKVLQKQLASAMQIQGFVVTTGVS